MVLQGSSGGQYSHWVELHPVQLATHLPEIRGDQRYGSTLIHGQWLMVWLAGQGLGKDTVK